jgi:hypothetical protein
VEELHGGALTSVTASYALEGDYAEERDKPLPVTVQNSWYITNNKKVDLQIRGP